MILRRPKLDELDKIRKLHEDLKDQFEFPDLNLISSMYVVVDEDEIIGFGAVQPIFESVVILNSKRSRDDRVTALTMLEDIAESELSSQGIHQLHAFVQDNKLVNFLKKRFKFKSTKGQALVKVI